MQSTVSLSTFQQTLARAIAAGRHDRGRLERAAALVVLGAVTRVSEHEYTVISQTDARTVYTLTPDGCECADRKRNPSQRCKHDLAVRLILQAEIDERRARFPELSDDEMARLAAVRARQVAA